jgi:hypothetical protein
VCCVGTVCYVMYKNVYGSWALCVLRGYCVCCVGTVCVAWVLCVTYCTKMCVVAGCCVCYVGAVCYVMYKTFSAMCAPRNGQNHAYLRVCVCLCVCVSLYSVIHCKYAHTHLPSEDGLPCRLSFVTALRTAADE